MASNKKPGIGPKIARVAKTAASAVKEHVKGNVKKNVGKALGSNDNSSKKEKNSGGSMILQGMVDATQDLNETVAQKVSSAVTAGIKNKFSNEKNAKNPTKNSKDVPAPSAQNEVTPEPTLDAPTPKEEESVADETVPLTAMPDARPSALETALMRVEENEEKEVATKPTTAPTVSPEDKSDSTPTMDR